MQDIEGGRLVRELYATHWAIDRYCVERNATETTVDIFNFKTLDQNLVKLEELLSGACVLAVV